MRAPSNIPTKYNRRPKGLGLHGVRWHGHVGLCERSRRGVCPEIFDVAACAGLEYSGGWNQDVGGAEGKSVVSSSEK